MSFDIDAVEETVKEHMDAQPYEITCSECGKTLDNDSKVDLELDLHLEVKPCSCTTNEGED